MREPMGEPNGAPSELPARRLAGVTGLESATTFGFVDDDGVRWRVAVRAAPRADQPAAAALDFTSDIGERRTWQGVRPERGGWAAITGNVWRVLLRQASVVSAPGETASEGLLRIGKALRGEIAPLIERVSERLRADPLTPSARAVSETELEDHLVTYLGDVFLAVGAAGDGPRAWRENYRGSLEIQRTIAELHGRQRRRLGWTPAELEREYAVMHEEIQGLVRHYAHEDAPAAARAARRLLARLVARARRCSRTGYASRTRAEPECSN